MKSIFEEMGGSYRRVGDYLIPNLELPEGSSEPLGKYGRLRQAYLKEHRGSAYTGMLLNGTLWQHLHEVDKACYEQLDRLIPEMAKREGVTEALKAANQLEWVGRMNNIRNRAEEIVLSELIYT